MNASSAPEPLRPVVIATFIVAVFAVTASLRGQSLDPSFVPACNADVFGLAIQSDGKILLAGNFSQISGVPRSRLARLNPDGTVDLEFNPSANSTSTIVCVQADGKILVGGFFSAISGAPRAALARLNADGSIDEAFNANITSTIAASPPVIHGIALQPDGKILIGGTFTHVGTVARNLFARLNPDGSPDLTLNVEITGANTPATSFVRGLVVQPDGRILVGGNFSSVAGQPRNGGARLNVDGSLDAEFSPNASSDVQAFALQRDGAIIMVGSFSSVGSIAGLPGGGILRPRIARFTAAGALDGGFFANINGSVRVVAVQPDGRILVGGAFSTIASPLNAPPTARSRLARLNGDGSIDATFDPNVTGTLGTAASAVHALVVPAPGQVVFAGAFDSVSAQPRSGIARLGSPQPTILTEPGSLVARVGSNVTLAVNATGNALHYQWKLNGVDVVDATKATLRLAGVQAAQTGSYTAVITNSFGSAATTPATLSLGEARAPTYAFTTFAGTPGQPGAVNATGSHDGLFQPSDLARDIVGNLYAVDSDDVIRRISPAGVVSLFLSGLGVVGIDINANGDIYFASFSNRIGKAASRIVISTFAGSGGGYADGPVDTAKFLAPRDVVFDSAGNAFVTDRSNFVIRKISGGRVSTLAGLAGTPGFVDGTGSAARFMWPSQIAVDASGTLYVTDYQTARGFALSNIVVRKVTSDGTVTTFTDSGSGVSDNGPYAGFRQAGIAVDEGGNVYLADGSDDTIRRISADGTVSTIGGLAGVFGTADGTGTAARFFAPSGIAVDALGNIYVSDTVNSTIRKGVPDALPLAFTLQPASQHVALGALATLTAGATGLGLSFQWKKDGQPIAGASTATFSVAHADVADMGIYSVAVTSGGSTLESSPAILTVEIPGSPARLINVATRGLIQPGGALTPGFVLRGSGEMQLVVRAVGPALSRFGLTGALADPRMAIAPLGGMVLLANDDWGMGGGSLATTSAAVGAFPLDSGSKDAGTIALLKATGVNGFTVQITGSDPSATGVALAEIYEADTLNPTVRLANVSTRGFVGTGPNALVPGFVIGGGGALQVLIRAVGPSLAAFGVPGVLADPQIALVPLGQDTPLASNDNWGGTAILAAIFARAGAFSLAPDSRDAAILTRLPPGAYTVIVSGVNNTTGVALVEVYEVPD